MSKSLEVTSSNLVIGKPYRITKLGKYKKRIGTAKSISAYGDVTLEFKNGDQVLFHTVWLETLSFKGATKE